MSVNVLLHEVAGGDETEERFVRDASNLLRKAVAMPGFGASVRQADYEFTGWQGRHGTRRELDGDEIWDRIVHGRELGHTGDHTLNLSLAIEDLPGPDGDDAVIGQSSVDEMKIVTARWFLSRCIEAGDRVNMAAHLMHQWMHISGFVHCAGASGKDTPAVLARLVRRALEPDFGEEIDARITALIALDVSHCDCCAADWTPGGGDGETAKAA